MAYEQYMKHSKNHRKDRFYQQCSGYFGKSLSELEAEEKQQEIKYFIIDKNYKIVQEANTYEEIVSKGIEIEDKLHHWIANSKMLMEFLCRNIIIKLVFDRRKYKCSIKN